MHRDLKPGNILVMHSKYGYVLKYSDFGESKHASNSHTHSCVGTVVYNAPELWDPFGGKIEGRIECRSIVGVTVNEMDLVRWLDLLI